MKHLLRISIIIAFFVSQTNAFGQNTKNVLFLGNSYTAANSLGTILESLALSANDTLTYFANTPGGYTLQGHSTNPTSQAQIQQGNWDYVVLQEQSQIPSWPIAQVVSTMFPYADSLCNQIRQANPCTKPLFFMTWGRKNGDSYNCPNWPPVCTYEGMDSLLSLRYRMAADSNDAYVSPVGAVWHYIRDNHNKINLYSSDGSHPSLAGSYAAACTFYAIIFEKDPTLITHNYGLDATKALQIRQAAKIIAFDSLAKWNVGSYLPTASFTSNFSNDTVHFENNSQYADSYLWQFGDGNTSNLFEPSHYYTQTGSYTVILESSKCDKNDTTQHSVQVIINQIIPLKNKLIIKVFPNPAQNIVNIQFDDIQQLSNMGIYSISGMLIKEFGTKSSKQFQFNIEELPLGIYLLKFTNKEQEYQYKIIKQ